MDFKKILCAALAALTVLCSFAACGGDTQQSDTGEAESAAVQAAADVSQTADRLKSEIEYDDELVEFDSTKIESILGISQDKYLDARVYVCSSGATPEEIACFEAVDEAAAEEIRQALETRIENQKSTFTDYKPEQAPKLEDAVLKVNGSCVYMCVSGDSAKAEEIIG